MYIATSPDYSWVFRRARTTGALDRAACRETRRKHRRSARRALCAAALVVSAVGAGALGCAPERAAARTRFLYYVTGNDVQRVALPGLDAERLLEFSPGDIAPGPKRIQAAGGKLVWKQVNGSATSLMSWDGSRQHALPVEPHTTGHPERFRIEYDEKGEIERLVPGITNAYLSEFLLAPDATQVVWNVNVVTGLSPGNAGTSHQRHLIYRADIDGKNHRLVLVQNYDVTGILADAAEDRHLLRWSRRYPEWVYFTHRKGTQLSSGPVGLYRGNVRTGAVEAVDYSVEKVLAFSADEELVAHTPNDDSCCGGVNQTNNRVLVKKLGSGRDTNVFDEWGEFANEVRDPGDEAPGEEIMPLAAHFSPDGRKLALTIHRWSSAKDEPSRVMTTVREIQSGARGAYQESRCAVGWQDDRHLVLGECHASNGEVRIKGTAFLFTVEDKTETPLPIGQVLPIGVGW